MRRLLLSICKWCWHISYRLYAFQSPTKPTVGGFWTRLVFLPFVLAFVPVYWLSICLWPLGMLLLFFISFIGMMRSIPYGLVIFYTGLGTVILGGFLFAVSKSYSRHDQPEFPQIHHAVTWPIRVVLDLNRRYAAACETPLEL